jgi:hypothetical protein
MSIKRRSFVVGPSYGLTSEEIKLEEDLAVVHLGDPPFVATVAPPGDPRESLVKLIDGSFLTDLRWMGAKRAKGRLFDSLIEAAAEAVEMELEAYVDAAQEAADPSANPLATADMVDRFIDSVNQGELNRADLLCFATPEDLDRVLADEPQRPSFEDYHEMIDEIEEEARIRGMPVHRAICRADEFFSWLEVNGLTNTPEARSRFAAEHASRYAAP